MPLWLCALFLVAMIVIATRLPMKGIYRWLKISLYVLIAITVLYAIAALFLISGID